MDTRLVVKSGVKWIVESASVVLDTTEVSQPARASTRVHGPAPCRLRVMGSNAARKGGGHKARSSCSSATSTLVHSCDFKKSILTVKASPGITDCGEMIHLATRSLPRPTEEALSAVKVGSARYPRKASSKWSWQLPPFAGEEEEEVS